MKKVIIFGSTLWGKLLFHDAAGRNDFEIACFSAERAYLRGRTEQMGLPVVAFEDLQELYPPHAYDMIAIFSGFTMREKVEKYELAKSRGYKLRNYVSTKSDVAPDLEMGENNVVLALSHVGFGGRMGNNNLLSNGVILGHEFKLGSNNELAAGCIIGGECVIGDSCFIAFGATIINHRHIATGSLIGANSTVIRDTEPDSKNVGNPSRVIGYHREEGIKIINRR